MSTETHLEKIKKLLRLSKSANAHEAELAMQRAMELAARHGVDLAGLGDPELDEIIHRRFPIQRRLSREWRYAIATAREFFHIEPCIDRWRGQVVFFGRPDAIEVADYVVAFLVRTCRGHAKHYTAAEKAARRRMTRGKRAAFIAGFYTGIHRHLSNALRAMVAASESMAIVLADDRAKREAEMRRVMGKIEITESKTPRRSAATVAGYAAGRNTQIHAPLAGGSPAGESLTQGALLLQ